MAQELTQAQLAAWQNVLEAVGLAEAADQGPIYVDVGDGKSVVVHGTTVQPGT